MKQEEGESIMVVDEHFLVGRIEEIHDTPVLYIMGREKSKEKAYKFAEQMGGAYVIPATLVR